MRKLDRALPSAAAVVLDPGSRGAGPASADLVDLLRDRFDRSIEAVFVQDLEGSMVYTNAAFNDSVGHDPRTFIGQLPPYPFWLDEDRERYLGIHRDHVEGKFIEQGVESVSGRHQRANGEIFPVLVTGGELYVGEELRGLIGFVEDLSTADVNLGARILSHVRALGSEGSSGACAESGDPLPNTLTAREREVLETFLEAGNVHETGRRLSISIHTVRNHLKAIYRKLGVRSRIELVRRVLSPR